MSILTYVSDLVEVFGIAFDKDDNLYIANGSEHNIGKIDKDGNMSIFVNGFNNTENIAFDNIGFPDGNMFLLDANKIYIVDNAGNISDFCYTKNGSYLGFITDKDNNIYYSSSPSNIYKIDMEKKISLFIDGAGVLNFPNGIRFDKEGNFYVCNSGVDYISKYNHLGELINPRFIQYPDFNWFNLIIDDNNIIYASYYDNNNDKNGINKYDIDGNFLCYVDRENGAFGLAVDSHNNLYYTDNSQTSIKKYDVSSLEKNIKYEATVATEATVVEEVPVATVVEEVPVATVVEEVPVTTVVEEVPVTTVVDEVPVTTVVDEVPVATVVEEVPVTTVVDEVPVATVVEEVPVTTVVEEVPVTTVPVVVIETVPEPTIVSPAVPVPQPAPAVPIQIIKSNIETILQYKQTKTITKEITFDINQTNNTNDINNNNTNISFSMNSVRKTTRRKSSLIFIERRTSIF